MQNYIHEQLQSSITTKEKILQDKTFLQTMEKAASLCINAYKNSKKILLAGNGGSAADAQHIAGELVSRFYFDRPGLAAVALTTDSSTLTAIGNDYGYHYVFARQVEANGQEGDIFFAFSTSGNSENILEALKAAKKKNMVCMGFSGESGGKMAALCDFLFAVPSSVTPRIQEAHITIGHILCALIEKELFST